MKKRNLMVILLITLLVLVACGNEAEENTKRLSINESSDRQEMGFSEESYISKTVNLMDVDKNVVAIYTELSSSSDEIEGYAISDAKTGDVCEYSAEKKALLSDLVSRANLPEHIIEKNPVYYAGPFAIVVTDDNGNLYNLMAASGDIGESITKEQLDLLFNN